MKMVQIPEDILFKLMDSHRRLSKAEHNRDTSYSDEHFSAKAEKSLIDYLSEHFEDVWADYIKWSEDNSKSSPVHSICEERRIQLFHIAKELFGNNNGITSAFQNEGCFVKKDVLKLLHNVLAGKEAEENKIFGTSVVDFVGEVMKL